MSQDTQSATGPATAELPAATATENQQRQRGTLRLTASYDRPPSGRAPLFRR